MVMKIIKAHKKTHKKIQGNTGIAQEWGLNIPYVLKLQKITGMPVPIKFYKDHFLELLLRN